MVSSLIIFYRNVDLLHWYLFRSLQFRSDVLWKPASQVQELLNIGIMLGKTKLSVLDSATID
jgi:hypothetical protein